MFRENGKVIGTSDECVLWLSSFYMVVVYVCFQFKVWYDSNGLLSLAGFVNRSQPTKIGGF